MKRLLRDLVIVVGVVGLGAFALWWFGVRRPAPESGRPLGGRQFAVSHAARPQSEVSVAVDPLDPRVLVAGSNDEHFLTRVYSSTDGGVTWSSTPGPLLPATRCGRADPVVTIAPDGWQYYALLGEAICGVEASRIYVAARPGPRSPWRVRALERRPRTPGVLFDDKPAIAGGRTPSGSHRGRVYLVWSRFLRDGRVPALISHSDDHGTTWSPPRPVGRDLDATHNSSVAVGPDGTVYVAVEDYADLVVRITRSVDGGRSFEPAVEVLAVPEPERSCLSGQEANLFEIPAQRKRCVSPNPTLAVSGSGRVYVAYATKDPNGTQGVYVSVYGSDLLPLGSRARVGPRDEAASDQFWPVAAFDRDTGDLWVCFYDTTGDATRTRTWFTCTVSRDGRRWAPPVRAASQFSDETRDSSDLNQYGDYESLAAAAGVAHPLWTDSRDVVLREEIYATAIRAATVRARGR